MLLLSSWFSLLLLYSFRLLDSVFSDFFLLRFSHCMYCSCCHCCCCCCYYCCCCCYLLLLSVRYTFTFHSLHLTHFKRHISAGAEGGSRRRVADSEFVEIVSCFVNVCVFVCVCLTPHATPCMRTHIYIYKPLYILYVFSTALQSFHLFIYTHTHWCINTLIQIYLCVSFWLRFYL